MSLLAIAWSWVSADFGGRRLEYLCSYPFFQRVHGSSTKLPSPSSPPSLLTLFPLPSPPLLWLPPSPSLLSLPPLCSVSIAITRKEIISPHPASCHSPPPPSPLAYWCSGSMYKKQGKTGFSRRPHLHPFTSPQPPHPCSAWSPLDAAPLACRLPYPPVP